LCAAALEVCEMAHADPVLPEARGAVGYGLVTARDGDYFGPVVNIVARASKVAAPGRVVATEEAVRQLGAAWRTELVGTHDLRGIGTTTVWTVSGATGPQCVQT
jgi:class 3 adenylate cyclase